MLDFPNSPTNGQTFTAPNGILWVYDGAKWANGTAVGTTYAPINSPGLTGNPTAPTPPAGDADTSLATTSFVAAATGTALNNVGRNLLHNPLFAIAQRGAGPWTATGYTLDRWQLGTNLDTTTASQQPMTDASRAAIGDESAQYFLQIAVTANAGAGAYSEFIHRIENGRRLAGKTVMLSFWANASVPLKLGIGSGTAYGTGGSPSAADANGMQIVNLVAAWTRYSVTINIPSATGRTFGTNGDSSTYLQFVTSSGTTNFPLVGVQTGIVTLWGVQLEVGSVATPLEKPDPQQDLAKCQRFACVLTGFQAVATSGGAGTGIYGTHTLPVTMRATPTAVISGPTYANANALTSIEIKPDSYTMQATATAGGTAWASASVLLSADL